MDSSEQKRHLGRRSARPFLGILLCAGLGLLESRPAAAQAANNALFEHTTSPAIISQQVRMALPSLERAVRLLNRNAEPAQLEEACQAILDTYKYLRAAQESTDLLTRRQKFPDPSAQMEMKRMWQIRTHMLACTAQSGHIVKQNQEMIDMCAEHLSEGIRQLRVLLVIMP